MKHTSNHPPLTSLIVSAVVSLVILQSSCTRLMPTNTNNGNTSSMVSNPQNSRGRVSSNNNTSSGVTYSIDTGTSTPSSSSSGSARSQRNYPLVFRADTILQFNVVRGQPQWAGEAIERVQGALWRFNSDSTFTYSPANSRTDLYPLSGSFTESENILNFSAYRTSQTGYTGSATTQVQGSIDLSSSSPILTMDWITTSGISARVNDINFAAANSSAYSIRATLVQE